MAFWRTSPEPAAVPFAQRFQKIKADIHKQVVESVDLSKIGRYKPERLRREIRTLAE